MEGVKPSCKYASLYSVFFLIRRFLTGLGLVVFVDSPLLQCNCLLLFSVVNLFYLFTVKPFENSKQNIIEIFNESTILACGYFYSIFMRGEGTVDFINNIGWIFIGIASLNVSVNMSLVTYESIININDKRKNYQSKKTY